MREKTWNIYNKETGHVLTWNGKCIDFNTKESAQAFLDLNEDVKDSAKVEEGIIFYDGGYISESEVVHAWQQEMLAELEAASKEEEREE